MHCVRPIGRTFKKEEEEEDSSCRNAAATTVDADDVDDIDILVRGNDARRCCKKESSQNMKTATKNAAAVNPKTNRITKERRG